MTSSLCKKKLILKKARIWKYRNKGDIKVFYTELVSNQLFPRAFRRKEKKKKAVQ